MLAFDDVSDLVSAQRMAAWGDVARRIAHEIKNPLTPMKLSIQYLERAVKQNPEQAKPLVKRISSTLIEQIDNLAQIADAFSNFGQMPLAKNEKVILNEVVETIHDLFRKRDDMMIRMSEPIEDLLVFADKNHLISILNNLLKNAIQSIPNNRSGAISIDLYKEALITSGNLSNLSSTHRGLRIMAARYAEENGLEDVVLLNEQKHLVEALKGTLYLVQKDQLITPKLESGCQDFALRTAFHHWLENQQSTYHLAEEDLNPFALQQSEALFVLSLEQGFQNISNYRKTNYSQEKITRLFSDFTSSLA